MFHVKFHYSWLPGQQQSKSGEMQLFGLLAGIHREGSLRAACQQVGLSYRYAWGLLGRWSEHFGQPLVMMEQGRGAYLTPLGKKLLWAQQRVQARLAPQIEALSAELERELASAIEPDTARLDIVASHDLALTAVRDHLARNGGPRLDVRFQGSAACLAALAAGQAEIAGFHVDPGHAEAEAFQRFLNPKSMSLVRFVTRRQGLILAAGNPKKVRGVKDLVRTEFINRQAGSGTRLAFDRLLSRANVGAGKIAGYQNEEFTHLAVAATIASGHAEAGMGIEAAARQYGLDFLPLFEETYFLACRTVLLESDKMQKFLAQLGKPAMRQALAKIPGYGVDALGTLVGIESAFKPPA
ncbi:MAG: helix-turn-helix transcriptional regulator [Betaproteobacteria bacterium]|nr:helix-turn-helix transcriptional regulator [Betaproteobacteria bacterium]